jgi:hypothetical protein
VEHAIYSADRARSKSENSASADRPLAERLSRIERRWCRRHRRWVFDVRLDDDNWIELSGAQLLDYAEFRVAALEQRGIFLPSCDEADWEATVKRHVTALNGEWTI